MRLHRLAVTLALVALTATACTSAKAPGWTFPAATAPAAPAASAPAAGVDQPAGTPGAAEAAADGHDRDRELRPGLHAGGDHRPGGGHVRGQVRQHGLDHPRRHLRRRHGHRSRGRADRDGHGGDPRGRPRVHLLDPGPQGRGHGRHGQRRRRHGRPRPAATATAAPPPRPTSRPDPNAPPYVAPRPEGARGPRGHRPRHRPRHRGEGHDRRHRLRRPGVWTFGGTVPGPVIRVDGRATRSASTSRTRPRASSRTRVDFHARQVAWNDEMTSINPGEEKLYEYKADYAGVWMYHCGTAPALHHIANGMYGMVIVEPKGGLAPGRPGVRLRPERVVPGRPGRARLATQGHRRRPGPRLRGVQRRRQPVQGQPDPDRDRQARPGLRPRRRAQHRQLVPRRGHDLRPGHQGGHRAQARQRRQLGLARPSTSRRPRARSSSSRWPRTASTRS